MNKPPITEARDNDLRFSEAAMQRAAERAREIALKTGTPLVVNRNGVLEHLHPTDTRTTMLAQEPSAPYSTGDFSMNAKEIISSALKLSPAERFELIEQISRSLDRPDPELDQLWSIEAEKRLAAYRSGQVRGIPASVVLGDF
jgi:putative addiction module component (TIGR02574 family)